MGVLQQRYDIETELVSRLQVASNSSQYPASRITTLIKDANLWATQLFDWDELYKWVKTTTAARRYYSYPTNMRTNTVNALQIDGAIYERKNYEDFESFIIKNPTSAKKIYALRGRLIWINPTPAVGAANNMHIYGCFQIFSPYDLANSTDVTIFSNSHSEGNEAIICKALSVAVKRSNPKLSAEEETRAVAILTAINGKQNEANGRSQRLNHARFSVPNFFAIPNGGSPIGKFSYEPDVE